MAVEFKDYYTLLGVPRTAGADEIKKAFRKLARQYHPDVAKDKKAAEEKFKEINEANEVLGDPQKRRKYDQLGANWKQAEAFEGASGRGGRGTSGGFSRRNGRSSGFDGTGFSDFFEQFFGGNAGRAGFEFQFDPEQAAGRGFPEESMPVAGADIEGDLEVTLDEVLHGSVRSVTLRVPDPETGNLSAQTFKVRIPAGVKDGQSIRVPGKGRPGGAGGEPGHLYLRVRYAAHAEFRTQGSDLIRDIQLAPWEAVLGANIDVPTLDGTVRVRIPAGTNPGQRLRVRERGLPRADGVRGDLFAVVGVRIPTKLSPEEKALWEKLAQLARG